MSEEREHAKKKQMIPELFEKLLFVGRRPLLSENPDCALGDHGLILSVVNISVAVNYRAKHIIYWLGVKFEKEGEVGAVNIT